MCVQMGAACCSLGALVPTETSFLGEGGNLPCQTPIMAYLETPQFAVQAQQAAKRSQACLPLPFHSVPPTGVVASLWVFTAAGI